MRLNKISLDFNSLSGLTVPLLPKGHYHNVSDNERKVDTFRRHCMRTIFKWINRKGRRHPMSWKRFNMMLKTIGFPKAGKTISMFPTR